MVEGTRTLPSCWRLRASVDRRPFPQIAYRPTAVSTVSSCARHSSPAGSADEHVALVDSRRPIPAPSFQHSTTRIASAHRQRSAFLWRDPRDAGPAYRPIESTLTRCGAAPRATSLAMLAQRLRRQSPPATADALVRALRIPPRSTGRRSAFSLA